IIIVTGSIIWEAAADPYFILIWVTQDSSSCWQFALNRKRCFRKSRHVNIATDNGVIRLNISFWLNYLYFPISRNECLYFNIFVVQRIILCKNGKRGGHAWPSHGI